MRFNLRLHGRTTDGQACLADVSVYADSPRDLQAQAQQAAESAAWLAQDAPHDPIPEGAHITIEGIDRI
jgi:hypothetical protein